MRNGKIVNRKSKLLNRFENKIFEVGGFFEIWNMRFGVY